MTAATVTVLFTDVVGSTEVLTSGSDDRWRRMLDQHRRVVEEAVAAHDGEVVKWLGDGAMATFGSVAAGLRAGVAIQQRTADTPHAAPVRAAVVTGEAVRQDDGDWTGLPVVTAARLCAIAEPGQVACPSTVAALLEGSADDLTLTEFGTFELEGFPRPVVVWEAQQAATAESGTPLPLVLRLGEPFPFVARPHVWEALEAAWKAAVSGGRELVLIGGEAGAGKTRMVSEFARRVHRGDAAVLYGSCTDPPLQPYQPFAEALTELAAELSDEQRAELSRAGTEALGLLVPALGLPEAGPPVATADPDAERFRLFSAVSAALKWLARPQPLLVIVEDIHWAGATTMGLLDHLMRGMAPGRVCFVATYRSTPSDASAAFRAALGDLRRRRGTTRLLLRGFNRHEVRSFVEGASGHPLHIGLEGVVDVLAEQTGGNALLVGELWRHLVDAGHLVRPQGRWRVGRPLDEVASPESVQEMVATRLARLPPGSQELLRMASVIGAAFSLPLLGAVAGLDTGEVLAALEPALAAGLVEESGVGTCRFTHAVVRRAIHDTLPMSARANTHAEVARQLEMLSGERAIAEVAHHLVAALPLGEPAHAVEVAQRASRAAAERVAYDEAARFLECVLPVAEPVAQRGQLLLQLADAHMRAGDSETAENRCLEAGQLGRELGDHHLVVSAALAFGEANWRTSGHRALAEEVLADALAFAADDVARVRLQAARGRALALVGRGDEAHAVSGEAVESARALMDAETMRTAFMAVLFAPWTPETIDGQLSVAREMIELAVRVGNAEWELWALDKLLFGEITAGHLDEARRLADRHHMLTGHVGQPLFRVLDLQAHALLAMGKGRFAEAEAMVEEANELGRFLSDDTAAGGYGVLMFGIRREQGRLDEARPMVEAVARLGQEGDTWRPALAVLYAELGMLEEAQREVSELVADGLAAIPRDSLWPAALSYLSDVCALSGDGTHAGALYAQLLPYRGLVIQVGHFLGAYGAADRHLGMLAALAGRAREAEQHFEAALRIDTRAQMPVWAARSHLAYGRFLATHCDRASIDRAQSLLGIAADAATRLGLPVVGAAAEKELGQLRQARTTRTASAAIGSTGLTDRELKILALLVQGQSNRQIGDQLHISHHTAANHVRAILLKTGCANRTEAAAWAVRNGLVSP